MKFQKSALIIALSSLLAVNAHADLNVSTAQGFKDAYSKIQILFTQIYQSQGVNQPVFSIENFKDNGQTSSFDDLFQMSFESVLLDTKILGTKSQLQASHTATETSFSGPISLFLKDKNKTYFDVPGEAKGSLNNTGAYAGQATFKNIKHAEASVEVKIDDVTLATSGKVNSDVSQFESLSFNYGLNGFSIGDAKSTATVKEPRSFAIKQASYKGDLIPTDIAGLYSGTGLMSLNSVTFSNDKQGFSLDSAEISAGMTVVDKLFDMTIQINLIKPISTQGDLVSNWGDGTINMLFKGMDAKGYALFQSKVNTLTNPDEIRSLMAGALSDKIQFDIDVKSVLAGQTASFAMSFKPTQALVELARSNTPMPPQPSPADIEKYFDSFAVSFTLPKAYFIEQGLNVERLRSGFDADAAKKQLEGFFAQGTMMATVMVPAQFQPIIKLEKDVVTFNLSYKNKVLNINGKEMSIADALRALGQ